MSEYGMRLIIVWAVTSLLFQWGAMATEQTWRLEQSQDWKVVSAEGQDEYLMAVAQIKKLVDSGQSQAVAEAIDKLKKDFPGVAAPDLDAFLGAEVLLCEGKFTKAANSYDKFLAEFPKSNLYEAALDRQFSIATAFLAGQKKPILKVFKIKGYAQGVKIMERLSDRAGDAPIGVKAALAVAKGYEKRGKFRDAYDKWSQIASRWPTGPISRDALLAMARCRHASYEGPKYDASNLISAKSYYENFKLRYPEYAEEIGVDKKLKQINEQLAYKQFSIGRYYQKTGNKLSANLYYQMVVDNWPSSTAAKMATQMMNNRNVRSEKVEE